MSMRGKICLVLLVANIGLWLALARADYGARLRVTFLDIGQGDAIFIEAPNGNQLLIDGSRGRQITRALGRVMPFYDRNLDVVLASHPDLDHIGGLVDVAEQFSILHFIESGVRAQQTVYDHLKSILIGKQVPIVAGRRGLTVVLDRQSGVYLRLLFPDRDPTNWETNEASVVARLDYGQINFLLTGDSPVKIERYLAAADGLSLAAEVLKVGHHGSRTSTSAEFLASVRPDYAIISAGRDNSYGHPHAEVLANLEQIGAVHLLTYEVGDIVFETDGRELTLVK